MATVIKPSIEHNPVNVLLTIENGQVIHSRVLHRDEFAATMETFFWLAEKAGYKITPPFKESVNEPNSDTDPSLDSSESN